MVTTETGSNYILISWQISNPVLQKELQSVQVEITSTTDPTQAQNFNVLANQPHSVNATVLGDRNSISTTMKFTEIFSPDPFVPYHVHVTAVICQNTTEVHNEIITIQTGKEYQTCCNDQLITWCLSSTWETNRIECCTLTNKLFHCYYLLDSSS